MSNAERTVLVLQHVAAEGPGLIADALRDAGLRVQCIAVHEGDVVGGDAKAYAGLVVMGGPMGVADMRHLAHLRDEVALLSDFLRAQKPILGICLGAQLLAHALGAPVYPGRSKEIGWYPVTQYAEAKDDPLLAGLPTELHALHWHGDVFDLPLDAVPLLSSARTKYQAFRRANAWGFLCHLEADRSAVAAMAEAFPEELAAEHLDPAALLSHTDQHVAVANDIGRAIFRRFAAQL